MRMRRSIVLALWAIGLLAAPAAWAQEPAPRTEAPVVQDSDYVIGAEDVLDIQVWGKPELSGLRTVDVQGMLHLPLVGQVRAAGRTPAELTTQLTERFQLLDSSISQVLVAMAQYNSQSVTVLGSVYHSGKYGFQKLPDLWTAILTAGGPTPDADLGRVQILRTTEQGNQAIQVDLAGGITDSRVATLPPLEPKDQILVPAQEDVPVGGDKIYVLGAVNDPGIYRIQAAGSVVEALAAAGGPDSDANLKKVFLTRQGTKGATATRLNLKQYLESGSPNANLPLQPGDTVTVGRSGGFWKSLGSGILRIAPFVTSIILATR